MGVIDLAALLADHEGILLASQHRARKSSLSRWCLAGRIVRVLPGVYVHPDAADDLVTRLRALVARVPDAIVVGAAAAKLTAWPNEKVATIEAITATTRVAKHGYRFIRRRVAPQQLRHRAPVTLLCAAQVAVDSAATDLGDRIDLLLRKGYPPAEFEAALAASPKRAGNRVRRRVVNRSKTRPFSRAERILHDLLDRHHLRGWVANDAVVACGANYEIDVAFRERKLALEVDGYEFHSSRAAFEADRHRNNDLTEADWTVLHITWAMLMADPERVIARIRAVLARRRKRRSPLD